MFIQWYVNLQEGVLCTVTKDHHHCKGRIVRFKTLDHIMQSPVFIFETPEGERIVLPSEHDFMVLPYEESLRFLIDLALHTKDELWFRELTERVPVCRQQF